MRKVSKSQWIKFGIIALVYILFIVWVGNFWWLLLLPIIFDIYISKIIPWGKWKQSKNKTVRKIAEWTDAIIFALIAVYFINVFIFQNYKIPSSSLEKSLLVGDFLFVSKVSYGPRVPNTPLSFPLAQHTLPVLNTKSYIEWPQWPYKRLKGFGEVKRNDIVVFNFPAGDTVALNNQQTDLYSLSRQIKEKLHLSENGSQYIRNHPEEFGNVVFRPVDRRENYVKRCIGMPGDSLQVIENQVYINGRVLENPQKMQLNYFVETTGALWNDKIFSAFGVSRDDYTYKDENGIERIAVVQDLYWLQRLGITPAGKNQAGQDYFNPVYNIPLTQEALAKLKKSGYAKSIMIEPEYFGGFVYPVNYNMGWTRDNYGPVWIPRKGATIELTEKNIALYQRCIVNYEHNQMKIENGQIFINGQPANTYTFIYDYYFMMGDNRHKSADSRYWGFVPEDHVVGKPILVWLSLDKDHSLFNGGIRWNRLFRFVGNK